MNWSLRFLFLLLPFHLFAQVDIDWSKDYGGANTDLGQNIFSTADGHFLLAATTESTDGDFPDTTPRPAAALLKIDSADGSIIWSTTLLFNNLPTRILSDRQVIVEDQDGYLVAAQGDQSLGLNARNLLFKVNKETGALIWVRQFSGTGATALIRKSRGEGYLLGSGPFSNSLDTARVQWIDPAGNLLQTIRSTTADWGSAIVQLLPTPDNAYYVLGMRYQPAGNSCFGNDLPADVWVARLNSDLSVAWNRTLGGDSPDHLIDAALLPDGSVVLLGRTICTSNSPAGDTGPENIGSGNWLYQLDAAGNRVTTPIRIDERYEYTCLTATCDTNLILGTSAVGIGVTSAYFQKTNLSLWPNTYWDLFIPNVAGFGSEFYPNEIIQAGNGSYAVSGSYKAPGGDFNLWSARFDAGDQCFGNSCQDAIATTIEPGRTYFLTTRDGDNHLERYACFPGGAFVGPEKVYRYEKTTDGPISVFLYNRTQDLDFFISATCGPEGGIQSCLASETDFLQPQGYNFEYLENLELPAGTYYFIVDGQYSYSADDFYFAIAEPLDCSGAQSLTCGTTLTGQTTQGRPNRTSYYIINGILHLNETDNSGGENLYTFTLEQEAQVEIALFDLAPDLDLELFLLDDCKVEAGLARSLRNAGRSDTIRTTLPAGDYYIVVDGFRGDRGSYSLSLNWNCSTCQADPDGTITVTSNLDDGPGTLRQAILCANQLPGPNTIRFQLPAAQRTIRVGSTTGQALPPLIDDQTTIRNDLNTAIILDGDSNGNGQPDDWATGVDGLSILGDGCAVFGLEVRRFSRHGLYGQQARALIIGEATSAGTPANTFSNNGYAQFTGVHASGIYLDECYSAQLTNNLIAGNYMNGIYLHRSDSSSLTGNEATGNTVGLWLDNSCHLDVSGNTITGNNRDETPDEYPEFSKNTAVYIDGMSSDNRLVQNAITGHNNHAFFVYPRAKRNAFRQNDLSCNLALFSNERAGIKLSRFSNDSDFANAWKSAPSVLKATIDSIQGTAAPLDTVDLYLADTTQCSGAPCQGGRWLGVAVADQEGAWLLTAPFLQELLPGARITALATDTEGNTSEFGNCSGVIAGIVNCNLQAQILTDTTLDCTVRQVPLRGSIFNGAPGATTEWLALQGGHIEVQTDPLEAVVDQAGLYAFIVRNPDGNCADTAYRRIDWDTLTPVVSVQEPADLTCTQTSLQLSATVGQTGLNPLFQWIANEGGRIVQGAFTLTPTIDRPGLYTFVATNLENGCSANQTIRVEQDQQLPVIDLPTPDLLDCTTDSIQLQVGVSNIAANATYKWNTPLGGSITTFFTPLQLPVTTPGTYRFTATNQENGCSAIASVTVQRDTLAPAVDAGPDRLLTCNGEPATLQASLDGGGLNPTLTWTDAQGAVISSGSLLTQVLTAGRYYFTALNPENGCSATDSVLVQAAPPILLSVTERTDPSCPAGADGSITLIAEGGTGTATIRWNDGQTGARRIQLPGGIYRATVTDDAQCTDVVSVVLTNPAPILTGITATAETETGAKDGTAAVDPSGGTPPYSVSWSNQMTGNAIAGLAPGTYRVTVTDDAGCSTTDSVEVAAGACTLEAIVNTVDASCTDAPDGVAAVFVLNAQSPVAIEWSAGGSGELIDNLPPGNYSVTVRDARACEQTVGFSVGFRDTIPPVITPVPVTLYLDAEGKVRIQPSALADQVSDNCELRSINLSKRDFDCSDLGETELRLTASDLSLNSQSALVPLLIKDTIPPRIIDCPGDIRTDSCLVNYSLPRIADNCPEPVLELVNGLDSGQVFPTGSTEILYRVTDAGGNTTACSFSVTVENTLALDSIAVSPSCFESESGMATLFLSGGQAPYRLTDAPIDPIHFLEGLAGGDYTVAITDNAGCRVEGAFSIAASAPIRIDSVLIEPYLSGDSLLGAISLAVSGGTPPYQFLWKNGEGETISVVEDVEDLVPGQYYLEIIDAVSCTFRTQSFTIAEVTSVASLPGLEAFRVFPNPTTGQFTLAVELTKPQPVHYRITDVFGRTVLQGDSRENARTQWQLDLSGQPAGMYLLTIRTAAGIASKGIIRR